MSIEHERLAAALPRYEIRREIGRGGWGVVYEGWHTQLQRAVAIKQLPETFGRDPAVRDRFIGEAQLVASLQHPHIVPVFDFVEHEGLYVIVMELATGGTLWERFSEHGLHHEPAIAAMLASAVGLHHAHTRGLVHRDVKPDNVLYGSDGLFKIADFGIAKAMNETQVARTATGSIIGTPAYMSPEQVMGADLGPGTDIYALGVMTYELLSGQLPFPPVTDAVAQLFQHVHEQPRPLTEVRPDAPVELAQVVHRALAKDAADRPATAEDFAIELAEAATAAFGTGWLARTGTQVMGSTSIIAATERTTSALWTDTVVTKPDDIARLRIDEPQEAIPAVVAPTAAAPATAQPAPAALAAPVAVSAPSRRPAMIGAAAVVIVLAIVGAVLALGGGSDEPTDTGPVTATEQAAFRQRCIANDVSDARCGCALDRAVGQLEPAVFRAGLEQLVGESSVLSPEFATIFDECVADGF